MDRAVDRPKLVEEVFGELGGGFDTLPARALHEEVKVDLNITGCPVEKSQVVAAISSLLLGDPPLYPVYPVCTECRVRENNCLLIEQGKFCCGSLTTAGCVALCPSLNVPCVGCRGPAEDANVPSAMAMFREKGYGSDEVAARLRTFAPIEGGN
jgi:coenzyme F420-reducing hydrogenase gamma subunit